MYIVYLSTLSFINSVDKISMFKGMFWAQKKTLLSLYFKYWKRNTCCYLQIKIYIVLSQMIFPTQHCRGRLPVGLIYILYTILTFNLIFLIIVLRLSAHVHLFILPPTTTIFKQMFLFFYFFQPFSFFLQTWKKFCVW